MIDARASLWIEATLLFLSFFVVLPSIAALIGYAAWKGKPKNFSRDMYWTAFAAATVGSGLLLVYALKMNADVRSWQYLVQLACFRLGVVLSGVALGCAVGVFTYRRRHQSQEPAE